MIIVVNRYENSITGAVNGKPFGVAFSEERYKAMKDLEAKQYEIKSIEEQNALIEEFEPMTKESFKELVEAANGHLGVNAAQEKYYLKFDDGTYDDQPLPNPLVKRILLSVEQKIDFSPLVKFWIRCRRNEQMTPKKAKRLAKYLDKTYLDADLYSKLLKEGLSEDQARQRATSFQTPLTVEGLLVTYKVSREKRTKFTLDDKGNKVVVDRYPKEIDEETGLITYKEPDHVEDRVYEPAVQGTNGDAFFCDTLDSTSAKEGHVIKVGRRHWLKDWSQVNCNDEQSCVKGLHVGNLDYIRGYQNAGTVTHNVFIDPMHVGAVTDDGSGALRVKSYFVYSSFQGVNKSVYHSSTYAAIGDEEYKQMLAEIQANLKKSTEDAATAAEQASAIASNLAPKAAPAVPDAE